MEVVLNGAKPRLVQTPVLLDVVEQLADLVVEHAEFLPTVQLLAAVDLFAMIGLPYHLLFETVLSEVLSRYQVQGISYSQVVGLLEAFAAVRLRLPGLAALYKHLRRPQELARLP